MAHPWLLVLFFVGIRVNFLNKTRLFVTNSSQSVLYVRWAIETYWSGHVFCSVVLGLLGLLIRIFLQYLSVS